MSVVDFRFRPGELRELQDFNQQMHRSRQCATLLLSVEASRGPSPFLWVIRVQALRVMSRNKSREKERLPVENWLPLNCGRTDECVTSIHLSLTGCLGEVKVKL
jgi:hypothetical protein